MFSSVLLPLFHGKVPAVVWPEILKVRGAAAGLDHDDDVAAGLGDVVLPSWAPSESADMAVPMGTGVPFRAAVPWNLLGGVSWAVAITGSFGVSTGRERARDVGFGKSMGAAPL